MLIIHIGSDRQLQPIGILRPRNFPRWQNGYVTLVSAEVASSILTDCYPFVEIILVHPKVAISGTVGGASWALMPQV